MMFGFRPSCVPRVPPKRPRAPFEKWAVVLAITLSTPAGVTALAQASIPASPLVCDLTAYAPIGGITAHVLGDVLLVQWPGAEDERLRLGLSIVDGTPIIDELAIRDESQTWVTIATDARIEFKITEGPPAFPTPFPIRITSAVIVTVERGGVGAWAPTCLRLGCPTSA